MEIGSKYKENLKSLADWAITESQLTNSPLELIEFIGNKGCYKCLKRIQDFGVLIKRKEESGMSRNLHNISETKYFFHIECFDNIVFQEYLFDKIIS